MAKLYSIVYQKEKSTLEPPYHFKRIPTDTVTLIADHGIKGDRKAGKAQKRQVNIMSYETKQALSKLGYKTEPGQMGEQLTIEGLDVSTLKAGDRIQLGDNAIIEITFPREPCEWFAKVQGKPQNVDVGMMATVIEGGQIHIGDAVHVLARVG